MIRSFLSFSFFRPPNAILVPGMYFFGFSRYSNYTLGQRKIERKKTGSKKQSQTHQGIFGPDNTLLLIGICVLEALDLTGLASEQPVEVWPNLVGATNLESVALGAAGLEQVCTLGVGAFRGIC